MGIMVKIGKIKKPFGLKGELVVDYFSFSKTFPYKEVYIEIKGKITPFKVRKAKVGKKTIISLQGIDSIDEAEKLKGLFIMVRREDMPELEEDEYYWVDLLGLPVERIDGFVLGKVVDIIPVSSADVLVVEGEREYLIPMRYEFIERISLEEGKVLVKVVKGVTYIED